MKTLAVRFCAFVGKAVFLIGLFLAPLARTAVCSSTSETRFDCERTTLTSYTGSTSEPSCGGTGLTVFLQGERVRHLDWTIETSTQFIRRQYDFDGLSSSSVVETIHAKVGANAKLLTQPRLLSAKRYRLDTKHTVKHQRELLEHAEFLINDFRAHRKEFSRVTKENP